MYFRSYAAIELAHVIQKPCQIFGFVVFLESHHIWLFGDVSQ